MTADAPDGDADPPETGDGASEAAAAVLGPVDPVHAAASISVAMAAAGADLTLTASTAPPAGTEAATATRSGTPP